TFLAGAGAAEGLALINSLGNSAGFFAPYITGWLADLTGTQNAGMWVVGAAMVAAGIVALVLRAAPVPDNLEPTHTYGKAPAGRHQRRDQRHLPTTPASPSIRGAPMSNLPTATDSPAEAVTREDSVPVFDPAALADLGSRVSPGSL